MKNRQARAARSRSWSAHIQTCKANALKAFAACGIVLAVAGSAVVAKEMGKRPMPLASVRLPEAANVPILPIRHVTLGEPRPTHVEAPATDNATDTPAPSVAPATQPASPADALASDPNIRWFDGRPVRPARTIEMVVTAYSPDARSCGEFADGMTATLHSVETNGHALVAADPALLPYGSMLTIPGYDNNRIVPVLDCGGAIKGRRLDVLYPTHEQARRWGRQTLRVTVWEYADGKGPVNPRTVR